MSRKTLQEHANRRQAIQRSAREVFSRCDYASASIKMIADAAEISIGAIYLHFESKEDLYISLLVDALRGVEIKVIHGSTGGFIKTWIALVGWASQTPREAQMLRMIAHSDLKRKLSKLVLRDASAKVADILTLLERHAKFEVDAGTFRKADPRAIAELAWTAFLGDLDATQMSENLHDGGALPERAANTIRLVEGMLSAASDRPVTGSDLAS